MSQKKQNLELKKKEKEREEHMNKGASWTTEWSTNGVIGLTGKTQTDQAKRRQSKMVTRTSLTKEQLGELARQAGFKEKVEDTIGNIYTNPLSSPLDLSRQYYGSCMTVYGDVLHEQQGFFEDKKKSPFGISALYLDKTRKKGGFVIWDGVK